MKFLFAVLLFTVAISSLSALEDLAFPFSWKPVEGAGAYKVEVRNEKGDLVVSQVVNDPRIELKLYPSQYSLRLTTINRFMLPESSTPWTTFLIPALSAPVFDSLEPVQQTWGKLKVATLRGHDLAGNLSVEFQDETGARFSIPGVSQSRDVWSLEIPENLEPGSYTLVLGNPPKQSITVEGVFRLYSPKPVVESVDPPLIVGDQPPPSLKIKGGLFMKKAKVFLVTTGGKVPLDVTGWSRTELTVATPTGVAAGTYQLEVVNETTVPAASVAFTIKSPRAYEPTMASLDRITFRNSNLPLTLTIKGSDFTHQAKVWLVKEPGLFQSVTQRVPLAVKIEGETTIKAEVKDELDVGEWHVELVNEPGKPALVGPKFQVLEDPISRQLRLSFGYNFSLPTGDWSSVYTYSPFGGSLAGEYFFTEHKRPIEGSVWDWGLRFSVDGAYYVNSWTTQKVSSSILAISAQVGPVAEFTLPFMAIRVHAGGGAVFSSLVAALPSSQSDQVTMQNLDYMASAGLGFEFPVNDFFRLELDGIYSRWFFEQPFDTMTGSLKFVFALPTKPQPEKKKITP